MAEAEAPSPLQLLTPLGAGPVRDERLYPRGRVAELCGGGPSDSSVQVRRAAYRSSYTGAQPILFFCRFRET